jgi:hypothetical protein
MLYIFNVLESCVNLFTCCKIAFKNRLMGTGSKSVHGETQVRYWEILKENVEDKICDKKWPNGSGCS